MLNAFVKPRTLPGGWLWPAVVAALAVLPAAFGEPGRTALRWQRDLLVAEPWRLLTGHLAHLDASHLLLNLAGLAVLWALVGDALRAREWSLTALGAALVIGVGLAWAGIDWYVGLSGVLHALLAAGAIAVWRDWRLGTVLLLAFLLVKGVLEWFGLATGDDVIVEAHWLGTLAGFAAGTICIFSRRSAR